MRSVNYSETMDVKPLVNPKKFLLWLFIVTIIMLFAAMTSAYLVRSSDGDWLKFNLPSIFTSSSAVILLSSATVQAAFWGAKRDNRLVLLSGLVFTIVLGGVFLAMQFQGWAALVDQNVFFGGKYSNPAGSFVYVLSGLHGFHLITGLIYLLIVLFSTLRGKVHSGRIGQIEMCTTYWHFLDLLWIYLFVFLQVNN